MVKVRPTRWPVQFSRSVVSSSLWPCGLQHARPPCPSPAPRVYSHSRPLSRWCHPTISSSVVPFSSCPQSFLASGSFQMSQLFVSAGQSTRVSTSSVLPLNIQDWFPLGWTGWISLQSKGLFQFKSINSSVARPELKWDGDSRAPAFTQVFWFIWRWKRRRKQGRNALQDWYLPINN